MRVRILGREMSEGDVFRVAACRWRGKNVTKKGNTGDSSLGHDEMGMPDGIRRNWQCFSVFERCRIVSNARDSTFSLRGAMSDSIRHNERCFCCSDFGLTTDVEIQFRRNWRRKDERCRIIFNLTNENTLIRDDTQNDYDSEVFAALASSERMKL